MHRVRDDFFSREINTSHVPGDAHVASVVLQHTLTRKNPVITFFSFSQKAFQRELAVVLMHFNRSVRRGINLKQIFSTPRQTMLGASHCAHEKANPPCQCYTASPVTLDIGKSYRYSGEKINLLLLKYGFSFLLLLLLDRPLMVMLTPPHCHTTHSHARTNVSLHFYSI